MTCIVEGCDRDDHHARGMCNLHYQQWRNHGNPDYYDRRVGALPVDPATCGVCADVAWLMTDNVIEDAIAERLGYYDRESLRRHLRRHRQDLVDQLTQRRKGNYP